MAVCTCCKTHSLLSYRMGDVVKECGVLQRKVDLLENQLKELHNEYTTFRHSSVTSADCVFAGSDNKQISSSLNLSNRKSSNILVTRFLSNNNPKV